MLFWGEGKWSQCSNVIAICRRIFQHLGLSTLAGVTRAQPSQLSSHNTDTFEKPPAIDKEERIRAFWMIEVLDSVFALGSVTHYPALLVPLAANLPCSSTAWALQDPFSDNVPIHNRRYSSGFSMCISLCTVELGSIHRFQQTVRESSDMREEFVAAVFRLINTEFPHDDRAEMQPFIVLSNCILNMAVIALLQSQTTLPPGIGAHSDPWTYADHRCMYACENMAAKIRRMEEDELKNCSPCLVLPIFVAARFYIVHTKCLHADVSVNLHSLAYSLHMESAASLYNAVVRGTCWKCACKDHHHLYIPLDNISTAEEEIHSPEPRFKIFFKLDEDTAVADSPGLWREVEAECHRLFTGSSSCKDSQPQSNRQTSFQSGSSGTRKQVHFAVVAASLDVVRTSKSTHLQGDPIADICAALQTTETTIATDNSIGFIADAQDPIYQHTLYIKNSTPGQKELESLHTLLTSTNNPINRRSRLTRRDRLSIAANLACSVLGLHGSWLRAYWRTEDIQLDKYFPDTSPLLSLGLSESQGTHNTPINGSYLVRSKTLFSLGLALVELSLSQALAELKGDEDEDSVEAVAHLKTAARHIGHVYSESGTRYGEVVERCLFASDIKDTGLENTEFQETVFHSVIAPLFGDLRVFEWH